MALIRKLEPRNADLRRIQPPTVGRWMSGQVDGKAILQLDTYGSPDRELQDKSSQTIQIDRRTARQLKRLLERSFPGI